MPQAGSVTHALLINHVPTNLRRMEIKLKLEEAKDNLEGKLFIKRNIDPVNTLLNGSPDQIKEGVERTINIGKPGGGFILSSACSVPPHTPPENLKMLVPLAEEFGQYL